MSHAPPALITISVLARRLRVPLSWLRAEADAGRIPALRAGRTYLCDSAAVEQALLDRARASSRPESLDVSKT